MTVHIGDKGIDEDWSKVDPVALAAAGFTFAIGYVSQDTSGKNLTASDVGLLHAAGIAVGLVYEYNPQSALGGYSQGVTDADIAIAHAKFIGAPAGVALYTAIDWNVLSGQMSVCLAYATGFLTRVAQFGYRSGVYGGYPLCAYLQQHNYGGFLWQTYAWSNGVWLAGAAVHQYENGVAFAGGRVDLDEAEVTDFGQWEVEMSTDSIILAFSQGQPKDTEGNDIAPVEWRIRDEAWQKSVTDALAALTSAVQALTVAHTTGTGTLHVSGDLTVS